MMKTSLGARDKYCNTAEKPVISEISRDLADLEEQQTEPRKRANMRELMFSTLKVIQYYVDILKSTHYRTDLGVSER